MKPKIMIKTGMILVASLVAGKELNAQGKENHLTTNSKSSTMSIEIKNKEAIRNLYENILNERKFELLANLVSDKYINQKGITGAKGFEEQVLALVNAFPDASWTILDMIAEGNKVIVNQRLQGNHKGRFQNFSATNKKTSNTGFAVYEFENGKIIKNQVQTDRVGFLQDLEILPTDLASLQHKDTRNAVNLIDKFFIPKNAIEEFNQRLEINRNFLKTLPGFIRLEEFGQKDPAGNLNFISVAFWENMSDVESAKTAVEAEYKRTGFDPADFFQRMNIKLERGLYGRYN